MKKQTKTKNGDLLYLLRQKAMLIFFLFLALGITSSKATNDETGISQQTQDLVTGVVTDQDGEPLMGVSVLVQGTSAGAATDLDGRFKIPAKIGNTLSFKYLGYGNISYVVDKLADLKITMKEDIQLMDEVVVVGYATQKRVNLSGAVSTVSMREIAGRPVTSLTNALQGTVPGMTVISRPGDVGGDVGSINVRGRGNLGTSAPLFVVDGIPVTANDFARINTSDVESISILKDASSSAIYGSRAAYGVILVTTKKGKEGSVRVQYNGSYGWQSATNLPDILGSNDYAMLYNEADRNAGRTTLRFTDTELQTIANGSDPDRYPDTDWYGSAINSSAPLWDSQISVSGGTELARYYVSSSIMDQESLIPGKGLNRYSFRSNVSSKMSKSFSMAANVSFTRDHFDNEKGSFSFLNLNRMVPLLVNKQSNGNWGVMDGGRENSALAKDNPIRLLEEGGRQKYYQNRFLGTLTATLTPLSGWNIDGLISYKTYGGENSTFTNTVAPLIKFTTNQPIAGTGVTPNQLDENWLNTGNFMAQATTNYELNFKEKHTVRILLGTSFENYNEETLRVIRKNFVNNSLDAIDGGSADPENTAASGNRYRKAFQSFFGRLNYSFNDRYLFEANMRADGSSQFAQEGRWGYFPSVSGAWRITQESFLNDVSWLQELKLRTSWGKLGNINNVDYYDFYDGLVLGTTTVLDQKKIDGIYPNKVANPALTWEKATMTNVGLDAVLFKNKLMIQVEGYHKMTDDILLSDPNVPDEAGLYDTNENKQKPSRNMGKVQNDGIELNVSYNGKIGNDFSFSIGGNLSKIWNKVVKLDGISNYYTTNSYYIMQEGKPIGSFYMWKSDGLFVTNDEVKAHATQSSATKAGDIKFVNQNLEVDNVINGDDRVIVGNDVPYFTYGINLNLSYKRFDLAMMGQGAPNVQVYLENEASQPFFNGAGVRSFHLDRWTTENPNPNANMPRTLLSSDNIHNLRQSDFWLFDASYFRIKSLSIGYNLAPSALKTLGIQQAKVYLASNNLFTIRGDKRLKDFDPEMASQRSTYPQLKTISVGVNITF